MDVDGNMETLQSLTNGQIVELVSGGSNAAESDKDEPNFDKEPPPPLPTRL